MSCGGLKSAGMGLSGTAVAAASEADSSIRIRTRIPSVDRWRSNWARPTA